MKVELLRCLLDKGTIDDDTTILVELPYIVDGVIFKATYRLSGLTVEFGTLRGPGKTKIILQGALPALVSKVDEGDEPFEGVNDLQ